MKTYVGVTSIGNRYVFKALFTPTEDTHGLKFAYVIGPFRTERAATYMADYGLNNPHLQTVEDAERLSRRGSQ